MTMTGMRLRIGDRELWLVPAACVEWWSRAHAQSRLEDAAAQWTGRLELERLAEGLPAFRADAVERVAEAFDRGALVAVRDASYDGLVPIFGGSQPLDWDNLPMLRELSRVDTEVLRPEPQSLRAREDATRETREGFDVADGAARPESARVGGETVEPASPGAPGEAPMRYQVTEVVLDGWGQGSVVMRWGGMRARSGDGVGTARGALRLAFERGVGQWLCVAGHADPQGSGADNLAVSAARARSVHLFASGDLDAWAEHAFAHATPTDLACALVACHGILGLGPAGIDDDAALDAARSAVRTRAGLATPRAVDAADWRAFADLYEDDLAALMLTDRAGLVAHRAKLAWATPSFLALGERLPVAAEELADVSGPEAPAHRRTSLLLFPNEATATEAIASDGAAVYDGRFVRTKLYVPAEVRLRLFVHDPRFRGLARASIRLELDGQEPRNVRVDEHGVVVLTVLRGTRVRVLSARRADGSGAVVEVGTPELGRFD
jgi:hypothetical protein